MRAYETYLWLVVAAALTAPAASGQEAETEEEATPPTPTEVAEDALLAKRRIEHVSQERADATEPLESRLERLDAQARAYEQPAASPEQVEKWRKEIADHERRIAELEAAIENAADRDPATRKLKADTFAKSAAAIRKELQVTQDPYNVRLQILARQAAPLRDQLREAFAPYVLLPRDIYLYLDESQVGADPNGARVGARWVDDRGQRLATAQIYVAPDRDAADAEQTILGRFPITSENDRRIELIAGDFLVRFDAHTNDWRGTQALRSAVRRLLDLEGLAALEILSPDEEAVTAPVDPDARGLPERGKLSREERRRLRAERARERDDNR